MRSSNFQTAIFLLSISLLMSCNRKDRTIDRVTYLRTLIGKIGFYDLPYTYDLYKGFAESKYNVDRKTMDSLFFDGGQIGGVLPDTTDFYCFLYYQVGDSKYPFLTTIDKKGNVIDKKNISFGNCRGLMIDIDTCIDLVTINKRLEIDLLYRVRGTGEIKVSDTAYQSVAICNTAIGGGRVTREGKIELTKGQIGECQ